MAASPSPVPGSQPQAAARRKRKLIVQVGLTFVVVVVAVTLVLAMVIGDKGTPAGGQTTAVRAVTGSVITTPGSAAPKAVLSMYEDFLCPACRNFEMEFGPTINDLIDSGAVAADYTMVAILDRPTNQNYSSRAGAAAYCVADEDTTSEKPAFRRFHAALYAQQPSETGTTFPTDDQLIEIARQAGADAMVPECITSGQYLDTVKGTAAANEVNATPTIRINGEDYTPRRPMRSSRKSDPSRDDRIPDLGRASSKTDTGRQMDPAGAERLRCSCSKCVNQRLTT